MSSSLFLTLTYPASEKESARPKRDLDTFLKRLARFSPSTSGVWKLEYTKAGTPHFHILLFGLDRWDHRDLARSWAETVASSNPHHAKAGTRIERPRSPKHAAHYVSKYIAKSVTLPAHHRGRCWGTTRNIATHFSPTRLFALSLQQLKDARRLLDKLRLSFKRTRPFARSSRLDYNKRSYCSGSEVIRYLSWLQAAPLNPTPT